MAESQTGEAIQSWEVGAQFLGPSRIQTLRHPLTRDDHPEWFWELRRSESNPFLVGEAVVVGSEITLAELFALLAGFCRFLWGVVLQRAKDSLSKQSCREATIESEVQRQRQRGS